MAENEQNIPEDILSTVESEHEGVVVRDRARKRRKRTLGGNKIIFFMVVFIALIVGAGLVWFFFPSIKSLVALPNGVQTESDNAPIETRSTAPRIEREVDTDRDGLSDIQEQGLGLSIDNPDTDGDGLSDRDEVDIYKTDPRIRDTDGDGFTDGDEVKGGYDPNGSGSLKVIPQAVEDTE